MNKELTTDKEIIDFAVKFEKEHSYNYRKIKSNSSDFTYLNGKQGVLITAPHSTNHIRLGKLKRFETFTAAIAALLNSKTKCHSLYTNCISEIDPNYYQSSPFKTKIKDITSDKKINFLVDLHGTSEKHKMDIYPGIGYEKEFLLGNVHIFEILKESAKVNDIKVGSLNKFRAVKQDTIAKFGARVLKIPSIQLEINKNFRKPLEKPKEFINLINFLSDLTTFQY